MYTLPVCIKHKCRDSYVLYIPTVHPFGLVLLTHTLLVQHTHMTFTPPGKILSTDVEMYTMYTLSLSNLMLSVEYKPN